MGVCTCTGGCSPQARGGWGRARGASAVGDRSAGPVPAPSPLRRPRRSAESDRWSIEHFSSFGDFRGFSVNHSPGPPLPSTSSGGAPPHDPALTAPAARGSAPQHPAQGRPLSSSNRPGEGGGWRAQTGRGKGGGAVCTEPGRGGGALEGVGRGGANSVSGGPSGRRAGWESRGWSQASHPCEHLSLSGILFFPSQAWPCCQLQVQWLLLLLATLCRRAPLPPTPMPSYSENRLLLLSQQELSSHSTCTGTVNTRKESNRCRIVPLKHLCSPTHVPTHPHIHQRAHQSIHPSTCSSIHSTHPPICLFTKTLVQCPPTHPPSQSTSHTFTNVPVHPMPPPSFHPSISASAYSPIHLPTHPLTHSSIHLSVLLAT